MKIVIRERETGCIMGEEFENLNDAHDYLLNCKAIDKAHGTRFAESYVISVWSEVKHDWVDCDHVIFPEVI